MNELGEQVKCTLPVGKIISDHESLLINRITDAKCLPSLSPYPLEFN